ncbi:response regulator transcription factor [Chelativorans intermedius]|uniref:LuxR C-terminal-related transcriptional regulator n=1 Tax=Chelativorans intermedius TaxID=515947 RepID=A0ABV6D4B9_9HYPH|nr:response regulator transcription factor [Chelativorans intermedius]MCT8997628.1 response regulator transcription factor [Chelativorans intermedius]
MMQRESSASAGNHTRLTIQGPIESTYRRTLLFIAPPGSVSDSMMAAVEREFGWISAHNVPEARLACTRFGAEVQLILVDARLLGDFNAHAGALAAVHPYAATAVMAPAPDDFGAGLMRSLNLHTARGVLPMDVNIDIWLSIIRIMLKGGKYFPPAMYSRLRYLETGGHDVPIEDRPGGHSEQWSRTMDELTVRELEVLAMVARGHQNKIIAADLGLSEHTVKIHIHNIIRKLGVHNRTEAAAIYFEYVNRRQPDGGQDQEGEESSEAGQSLDATGKRAAGL